MQPILPIPTAIPSPTPTATQATPGPSQTWAGRCTGPFNGLCSLTLTRTANALDGTFVLSSPSDHVHVSGYLSGPTISFGAVGVVTFTGILSGTTMSGSYRADIAGGKTGSWRAALSP